MKRNAGVVDSDTREKNKKKDEIIIHAYGALCPDHIVRNI
jgi:hypothetical protein